MRLLHIRQRVTLLDVDLHVAAQDDGAQVVHHGLVHFARGDVGEERLARHVERTLGAEHGRCKRRYRHSKYYLTRRC